MRLSQFSVWHNKIAGKDTIRLSDLKAAKWPTTTAEDSYFNRFQFALEEVPTEDMSMENNVQLERFLKEIVTKTSLIQENNKKRLRVLSKLFFLSNLKSYLESELEKDKTITEVNVYAEYAIVVDCSLSSDQWHGINLSLVSEKIIIQKDCQINLSGQGHDRKVNGKAGSGRGTYEKGENGSDGVAGESSGNFLLCANVVKNPEKLKDYDPGSKWTKTFGHSEYKGFEEWIERTYECDDGRQMDFAIAGMRKLLCTVYDFRVVLKGVKGTMGTEGGSNGVGGEGGNRGEFLARRISSGDRISGVRLEMKKGSDGQDGKCGRPGDPGSNGNDVALIDQSGGGNPWEKRVDRYYYGHK
ncbi:unnamed protein product, partial [Strongylus vulgaris]